MNSSGSATRSAPSRAAWARAARALSAFPAISPTVGLSCATAIASLSAGRAFMGLGLEHFQEKWEPVFRPKMRPTQKRASGQLPAIGRSEQAKTLGEREEPGEPGDD